MPPKHARSGPQNRRYYDWHGERFWSVTTLTKGGLPESFGLAKWKRTIVAKGAVEAVQNGSLVPMVEAAPGAAVAYLAELPFQRTKRAQDLGTEVHAAIEALVLGTPIPEPSAEAAPYLEQFGQFLTEFDPTFIAAEASVYHRRHWYAGTLDSVVEIDGRRHVLDVKTGAGVYPEVALQLAAYANAEFIGGPDGKEYPMEPVDLDTGLCLHLQPDGFDLKAIRIGEDVYRAFLYCRETFRWDTEIAKTVWLGTYRRASLDPLAAEQLRIEGAAKAEAARPSTDTAPASVPAASADTEEASE